MSLFTTTAVCVCECVLGEVKSTVSRLFLELRADSRDGTKKSRQNRD